ncbi:MAG: BPTD_3080 family restriction endonuclease [Kineosporiaceae bacterium]
MTLDDPVLNGPFDPPGRHFEIGDDGPTGAVLHGRRPSESWIPIPASRKRRGTGQAALDLDVTGERREPNPLINAIRRDVETWRLTYQGVTPITRKLLEHWADPSREDQRVLFCQREAVETTIFLAEVAGRRGPTTTSDWRREIDRHNADHNAGLPRVALKMATGSGKTVVMAMLIAWQTINHAYTPRDARFTDRFLVVTPGITIRDRLRVLRPSDDENYYRLRDLVPADLQAALQTARIGITNYHTFLPRDRPEIKGVASRTRRILTQGGSDPFRESADDVVSRVLRDLGLTATGSRAASRLMVLNDEAHHCYRDKPIEAAESEPARLAGETAKEVEERNEAARVWFRGLQAIHRRVGVKQVYDLSATPYYLGGSGYAEGYIFPWAVSDFSLMDAIESGIVKVPRIPVDDDAAGQQVTYLRLWDAVGRELPKRRAKQAVEGAGWTIPAALQGALESLYRSYEKAWAHYEAVLAAHGEPPPVFIVVCSNTVVSKLVHDWMAGSEVALPGGDGATVPVPGTLPLFSNVEDGRWLDRPRTLLIDSARLESGEALRDDFRAAAAAEIEQFKAEYRRRSPGADVDQLTDEDLLREVMNTVGKPGRLGGDLRCIVSVSMLTEGWDANTVTHILGIRAFTSQLLCEQVVGRGLRRRSYAINDAGHFDAEYATVYGVPFSFIGGTPGPDPRPQPPALHVRSELGREHLRITFPHVTGYRLEIPDLELHLDLTDAPRFTVTQEQVAMWTQSAAIVGEDDDVDLRERLASKRAQQVAYEISRDVTDRCLALDNGDRRPWLFPQVCELTRQWLDTMVDLDDGLPVGFLTLAEVQRRAAEAVHAVLQSHGDRRARLRPILRHLDPLGSTAGVSFLTRKPAIETTRSEVSHVVLDGRGGNTWEQILALECEQHRDIAAYVKNDHVGFSIPYVHKGVTHSYVPDFLVRLKERAGDPAAVRTLIVEVSGGQKSPGPTAEKAFTARQRWCAAVNNHGGFGRWGYVEVTEMTTARQALLQAIDALYADQPIVGDPDLLDTTLIGA